MDWKIGEFIPINRQSETELYSTDAILDCPSMVVPFMIKKEDKWPPKLVDLCETSETGASSNNNDSEKITTPTPVGMGNIDNSSETDNQQQRPPQQQNDQQITVVEDKQSSTNKVDTNRAGIGDVLTATTIASLTNQRPQKPILTVKDFFKSSAGEFLIGLGLSRVREHTIRDDIRKLKRQIRREDNCQDLIVQLEQQTDSLNQTETNNKVYNFDTWHQCEHCGFKTESACVLERHLYHPHVNNRREFRCNWCPYKIKDSKQIVFHNHLHHKKRCYIDPPQQSHECYMCPYESNSKAKCAAHVSRCVKTFMESRTQALLDLADYPAITPKPITQSDVRGYEATLQNIRIAAFNPRQNLKIPGPISPGVYQQQMMLMQRQAAAYHCQEANLLRNASAPPNITIRPNLNVPVTLINNTSNSGSNFVRTQIPGANISAYYTSRGSAHQVSPSSDISQLMQMITASCSSSSKNWLPEVIHYHPSKSNSVNILNHSKQRQQGPPPLIDLVNPPTGPTIMNGRPLLTTSPGSSAPTVTVPTKLSFTPAPNYPASSSLSLSYTANSRTQPHQLDIQAFLPLHQAANSNSTHGGNKNIPVVNLTGDPLASVSGSARNTTSGGGTTTKQTDSEKLSNQLQKSSTFVICEICDGYIKDLDQLKTHMQWIHKVKIHQKMLESQPPLNCQKCQWRFFTDQGLERHLLGAHGLVTSNMQEQVEAGVDAGRCTVCGRAYSSKLVQHMKETHKANLKPAHLSYKCTVCSATFNLYRLFENHVYTVHSESVKRTANMSVKGKSIARQ